MISDSPTTEKPPGASRTVDRPRGTSFRLSHLMVAVLGCGLVCWLLMEALYTFGPITLALAVIGLAISVVATIVVMFRGQAAQREALVQALAIAARRGMPLSPTLEVFAQNSGVVFRNRVLTLADALRSGLSLPDALDRCPRVLPLDAEVILRVGWEAGIPVESLQEAANRPVAPPRWVSLSSRLAYLLGVLIIMQGLCGFILYFITPKFEAIFKDFGIGLPPPTLIVIQGGQFASKYGIPFGLLFAGEVFLLIGIPLISGTWMGSWLPFFDRIFLRRHAAVVLRSLARVVECEKPLPPALATLARKYPSSWVRDRLQGVALDLDRGRDWCESLYYHSLITATDAALLDAARRAGNLPWALREAADTGERRLAYRLQAIIQVVFPILMLGLGALVLMIATAYFTPLIVLIQRLAG